MTKPEIKFKTYYVTVEGVVTRVMRVEATSMRDAMAEAKQEFTSALGADTAVMVSINEAPQN